MKKITAITLAAAAAALGFSSCQKNEIAPLEDQKEDFSIYADITKTAVGDTAFSTVWAANDAINVFHAAAGSETYSANSKFTISNEGLTKGQFTGTLSGELSESNDWYALYPYSSSITHPATGGQYGYLYIGCTSSHKNAQIQEGNGSSAHLAGQFFPLWAKATGIAKSGNVSLKFAPVASIVKIVVKNSLSSPLEVSDISFTAKNEDVIGSYFINFTGATPVLTKSGDGFVSNTAKLKVNNPTAIPANDTASFYLAVKPFSTSDDDAITIDVNGLKKETTAKYSFEAGHVKVINFDFDEEIKSYVLSFPDDNSANNKVTTYTSTWPAKTGEKEFSIYAFNNNKWEGWTYIKAGRKKDASTPYIKTNFAFEEAINSVAITYGPISNASKITSAKLIIASDADFTTGVTETALTLESSKEVTTAITSPAANKYYKIAYDIDVADSNGIIQIDKITFFY